MPRLGRELEKLVSTLEESLLLASNATVTSPAFLKDQITGETREIDVCVRSLVGSVEVVIIFECRDRSAVQDVTWIEQLAQKRNDVLASRAVAVSASGFSQSAIRKAHFLGIELRTFEDLEPRVVEEWLRIEGFKLYIGRAAIHGADLTLDGRSITSGERPTTFKVGSTEQCFLSKEDSRWCSLQEIWNVAQRRFDPHATIPVDGTRVWQKYRLTVRKPERGFRVRKGNIEADVITIDFDVELWHEAREVPLNRVFSCKNDEKCFMAIAEYIIVIDGKEEILSLHKDLRTGTLTGARRALAGSGELGELWIRAVQSTNLAGGGASGGE